MTEAQTHLKDVKCTATEISVRTIIQERKSTIDFDEDEYNDKNYNEHFEKQIFDIINKDY